MQVLFYVVSTGFEPMPLGLKPSELDRTFLRDCYTPDTRFELAARLRGDEVQAHLLTTRLSGIK